MIKKKLFMLKKLLTDLRSPRQHYSITSNLHSQQLGEYYFLFSENRIAAGKDQQLLSHCDENGIPLNKTYIDVSQPGYIYFPITIGQMGLAVFHSWLSSGKQQDKDRFLKFAHWFAENAEVSPDLGARWLTKVPLPQYQNPGPWQSAFAQARAISILLRGYQLIGNETYSELAHYALTPFTKTVIEGGVTSQTDFGPFYEEYTASVPTLVLNGMIFALLGIYDFIRVFPESELARNIFYSGTETLKNILPDFDLGYWSRYNLCQADWYPEIDPATINYQRLHIVQLDCLYKLTGEITFRDYMLRFQRQDCFLNALRMYNTKYHSLRKIGRL